MIWDERLTLFSGIYALEEQRDGTWVVWAATDEALMQGEDVLERLSGNLVDLEEAKSIAERHRENYNVS